LAEAPSPATNTRWRERRLPSRSAERKPAFGRSGRLRGWLGVVVVLRVLLVLLARAVMMMMVVVVNRGRPHRLRRNHRGRERERAERQPDPGCIARESSFPMERRPGWAKG